MKKYLLLTAFVSSSIISFAQMTTPGIADTGTFLLHKFAQNIGKETYRVKRAGGTRVYDINFKFTDRGSPVPLHAQLVTNSMHEPLSLFIKGSTSRFSTINDSISIESQQAIVRVDDSVYQQAVKPLSFPVGGYSPGTVQMILLQYWIDHQQPKSISMLPNGTVNISWDGKDTLLFANQKMVVERYVLGGLVWGNEIIWTDSRGNIVCLITNDAEGDKLEMMQEQYESLLPEFISRAATYGMKLFTASMKEKSSVKPVLAIIGGNVVDVENDQPISNSVILVENGVIKKIGKVGSIPIPANAIVIHAEGKTILPGLWDMHAHFQQAEWGPAYLASGVTTVRDCGNEFGYINAIKSAIDSRKGIGPNILKAGIIDGPGQMGLGIVRATTKAEAIKAVKMYKDNGFVQIKIYSSITPAIVKVIADEAHRLGLSVTGHIPNGMGLLQGLDSGMDQVNHMQYVYAAMKKNADKSIDLQDPANMAVLNYLHDHKIVIDPTMGVFEMIFRSVKDDILKMEPAYYTLPVPLQSLFSNMGMPEAEAIKYKPLMQSMMNLVKALHDKGVTIVAGTDMGFPGYSVFRELELYVDAGLSPMEAIQTATIVPAQVMKLGNKSGSIKAGKQADLVIIDGDPLQNIRNIRKVWMVIKEGRQYDPVALHKMVGFSK